MNARRFAFLQLLSRLYALALRLYPKVMRGEYASEMQSVFRQKAADAAQGGGWALIRLACREAHDLPYAILSAHLHDTGGRMHPSFPATSDQTPWIPSLLSLVPFFLSSPLKVFVSYQPGWRPEDLSQAYLTFLVVSLLTVTIGFVWGIVRRFPRWAYPYPIFLAFSLHSCVSYAVYLNHGNTGIRNSFPLYLTAIFLLLCLPGLRSFYRHVPQDWTLLSYGLYGFALFFLSLIDKDETPTLTLLVLLPSLLSLCTALAHLRIRSSFNRILVLPAGIFIALFFLLIPIFQGMVTIWAGIMIGSFLMLIFGGILTAIILSPWIVRRAIDSRRA